MKNAIKIDADEFDNPALSHNPQSNPNQFEENKHAQQHEDPMSNEDIIFAMSVFPDQEPAVLYDIYI